MSKKYQDIYIYLFKVRPIIFVEFQTPYHDLRGKRITKTTLFIYCFGKYFLANCSFTPHHHMPASNQCFITDPVNFVLGEIYQGNSVIFVTVLFIIELGVL